MHWNDEEVRAAFPALALSDAGVARLYADAPGGTQVAGRVLDRMREALIDHNANEGGFFRTSVATDEGLLGAHAAAAAFVGGDPDEVVFGLNTTSLLFHFSRMIARDWQPGDEIVLSRMDHDANVGTWLIAAAERGVTVRWLDIDPATFRYRYDELEHLVGPRTRLVACNHASNLLGTINDVARIVAAGRAVGAVTVVDGVQSAPHVPLDAHALGCDLLTTSPYKYFGPHAGLLYVRRELGQRLAPLKIRTSPDTMPHRHAPGTPSFEAQLGTVGAIEHIAWLGTRFGGAAADAPLRARLTAGLAAATRHEHALSERFLAGLTAMPHIKLHGIADPAALEERVPTFSFTVGDHSADAVSQHFSARNMYVASGSFYAMEPARALGVYESGIVRVGFSHYNTRDEVDAILAVLATFG
jgi:cysteine desulfurase family protein (TIGR01976 family)